MWRDELYDVIYEISPKDTPFIGWCGGMPPPSIGGGSMRSRKRRLYAGMRYRRRIIRTVRHEWVITIDPSAQSGIA